MLDGSAASVLIGITDSCDNIGEFMRVLLGAQVFLAKASLCVITLQTGAAPLYPVASSA